MTTKNNLLVELFVEELPPKALKKLGDAFAAVLRDQLVAAGLADAGSVLTPYASPRRRFSSGLQRSVPTRVPCQNSAVPWTARPKRFSSRVPPRARPLPKACK